MNQVGALAGITDGILGNVSLRLAELQGIAGVEHAAVSIATTVDEVFLGLLGSSTEHGRPIEIVGEHGL